MPAVMLNPTEVKLLHLVLNKGAADGEVSTGAIKLIESLRRRDVQAADIEQALAKEPFPAKQLRPDFGLTPFPFAGRNKGRPIVDIAPRDLRNAIRWARSIPEVAQRFRDFIADAERFLEETR